jgi:hypothetical protein
MNERVVQRDIATEPYEHRELRVVLDVDDHARLA